jgi:iron(II)-dependent oxidoreductase
MTTLEIDVKDQFATALVDARQRTEQLLDHVDDTRLMAQHNTLMSPLTWDYAHAGVYQELWLVHELTSEPFINEQYVHLYDAFENPRRVRGSLPLMSREQVKAYRDRVDERTLEILASVDLDADNPLLREGYVYQTVIEHEHMHDETILQALQLLPGGYRPEIPCKDPGRPVVLDMVAVPAGRYPIGSAEPAPWDNEHPRREVELEAFRIDRFPVTNAQYQAFIEEGGYERREFWSDAGWTWRTETGASAPQFWRFDDAQWMTDRFGYGVGVDWDQPVMHVCYYEAEAYARWAGKRLPTEFEWEVAAAWDPQLGRARRYPWGDDPPMADRANLDQFRFGCAQIGAYPQGASALGCEQMIGDVYEWTSSDFLCYPGFVAFPYPEYSEVFFGADYKVLRGASWATRPSVARCTFRNWDYPIRRQIFAGFRCAMDDDAS